MRFSPGIWVMALIVGTLSLPFAVAESWNIQTVDSGGGVGKTSMALDSSGNPHIIYYSLKNVMGSLRGYLEYAKWTGKRWDIQTVDSGESGVGEEPSIALDSSGNPHISYNDYPNDVVKYAKWTGSRWDIETIDSGGRGNGPSIALDSSGSPHISYSNRGLKYAKWTGSRWDIQTVDSVYTWSPSIALDSYDRPHISYYDNIYNGIKGNLKYAKWTGSRWDIQTVDSSENAGWYPSIAIDSYDRPHISYYDDYRENGMSKGRLKYAKWTGSSWSIETVDSSGYDVGQYTSIALDSSGNPHISYAKYIEYGLDGAWRSDGLKYAKWTGSGWKIETVDSGDVGSDTSIALDSLDNVHISYRGGENLKYALLAKHSFTFQTTDNSMQVTVDGTQQNSPYSVSWMDGTTHSISVTPSEAIISGQSRYVFSAWSGMSTSNSPSISINSGASTAGTYSANYKKQYYMIVNTDPAGLTSISGNGWYDSGTTAATGTAPGTSGPYTFSTWKVDGSPASGNPVSVHMTAPHTDIAVYQASVISSIGNAIVYFDTPTGTFQDLVAVNPIEIPLENLPLGAILPYGLFRFNITNVPVGGSVTLTLTFPKLEPNTRYLKYGRTSTNPSPHYYYMTSEINGNKLTITLIDGGNGDDDLVANGKIKDDGGPATMADIRPTEIVGNISGIPVVNESTVNILAEDYLNFSAGDLYKITITRVVDGVEEFNKSGTLPGLAKETIKLDWTPQTTGDYVLRSEAGTIAGSKTVMVINQKVIQPVPEIATIALVSIGILGLFGLERRRRNQTLS